MIRRTLSLVTATLVVTAFSAAAVAQSKTAAPKQAAPAKAAPAKKTGSIKGKLAAAPAGSIKNSVVFLRGSELPATPAATPQTIEQKGKQFVPAVLVVTKGSTVEFPNNDRIMHNVFSRSENNAFDLGHYKKGESKSTTFTTSGVVDVYCNIHPNMVATVLVVDNDFYVSPKDDGTFELANVPAGSYELVAWTPNTKPVLQKVEVKEGKATKADLQLPKATERLGEHSNKQGQPYSPGYSQ